MQGALLEMIFTAVVKSGLDSSLSKLSEFFMELTLSEDRILSSGGEFLMELTVFEGSILTSRKIIQSYMGGEFLMDFTLSKDSI
ncbi:hypothetical protein ACROYT_G040003 [Oculina patagonica]